MELAGAPAMHGLSLWSLTQLMSMDLAGARGLSLCLQTLLGTRENASECRLYLSINEFLLFFAQQLNTVGG